MMTTSKPHHIADHLNPGSLIAALRPTAADERKSGVQAPPYGIVDRVTLSSEGIERSRRYRVEDRAQRNTEAKTNLILLPFSPDRPSD